MAGEFRYGLGFGRSGMADMAGMGSFFLPPDNL